MSLSVTSSISNDSKPWLFCKQSEKTKKYITAAEKETVKEPISKRPAFIEPLHDIVVMAGEEVTFMCKATGKPLPTFKW
jgi:ApbE superfamily uncharacterized protein (UPF0280 family)